MANLFSRQRRKAKTVDNTGFSNISSAEGSRLINKDGSTNLRKTGIPFWERYSLFHLLIRMKWLPFLCVVFLFYTVINCVFAGIYVLIGVDHLKGVSQEAEGLLSGFSQAFFFSSQTLTTVGYGHITPLGLTANIVAAVESFAGILSFAMMTGLLYGRFSLPKAYLRFSEHMLVSPHKGKRAIMVRFASYKNNHITDAEAKMTMALRVVEDGHEVTRFYTPELEISRIASLALSWTVVHLIDEDSPLHGMSNEQMKDAKIQVILHVKGFDENFSNIVQQRTSYTVNDLVYGAKFTRAFHQSEDGSSTILEVDKLDAYQTVDMPQPAETHINT